jgi:hypothetical protein
MYLHAKKNGLRKYTRDWNFSKPIHQPHYNSSTYPCYMSYNWCHDPYTILNLSYFVS